MKRKTREFIGLKCENCSSRTLSIADSAMNPESHTMTVNYLCRLCDHITPVTGAY